MDSEDQRDVELSTLSAIYPELQTLAEVDPYTFTLDIPVNPAKTVTVYFPASTGQAPDPNSLQAAAGAADGPPRIDSHQLSYLPAVRLQISLPASYPSEQPPVVHVSTKPSWLPEETAQKLESECARLWEELGRDLVIFSYVDHVQQSADDVFGLVSEDGALEISPEHKISILDHDIGAKRAAFEKQTFDCGVCLDPKRGSKCHQMLDCGHVFCVECLQDFYNNAIKGGDVTAVRCLEPNCAKEREDANAMSGKKLKKSKVTISPSELLQIPIEPEMVKRYVTVKYKTELESDKNTIYCPRSWCQGAAKSKKHKKPQGLELADDDSDDEGEETGADSTKSKAYQPEDRLAVCEDCNFAFCSRCLQSWHGEFVLCAPPRNSKELSEEEKASLDFINLHTTPCPTCNSRAQKTHGCNHMNCFRCHTHFCYLCSAWLDPSNPYAHYNSDNGVMTGCYMRLWDLEEGDQDGDPHFERPAPAQAQNEDAEDIYQALRQGEPQHMQRRRRPDADPNRVVLNGQVNLVPEGPRVFRLDVAVPQAGENNPTQPAVPAMQPPPPQQQARGQARAGGNPRQGRQQQPGPRGRGGRGRGGGNRQNQGQRVGQPVFRRDRQFDAQAHEGVDQGDQLEDRDAAWVRNFVQLALEDNEDLALEDDEDMAFEPFD